jgi:hypothetical protein
MGLGKRVKRMKIVALAAASAVLISCEGPGEDPAAAVTRFTITARESPAFDGMEFGAAGQYEILSGVVEAQIDPADPRNAIIHDLELAPREPNGMVRYETTVAIAKPIDMSRSTGVLVHLNSNRGGSGFTIEDGFASGVPPGDVEVLVGWQAELLETARHRVTHAPVARNPDGSDVTGTVLARMADMEPGTTTMTLQVLGRDIPYDAVMDQSRARLVRKESETRSGVNGPTTEIPASDWAFADCGTVPFPGTPSPRHLCLRNGFDPAFLYEMSYEAKNPLVLGVGLAALRDVNSFLRYETADAAGNPNPLAGGITHAVIQGVSQSGNILKTFLNLGFNQDLEGRIVFDGANPHIAGRQTSINVRFGLPSGSGTLYEPGGEGVLWWSSYADTVRKGRAPQGLLDRCAATNSCPKIFETFGASEFTGRLMSVALTGTDGKADLPLPSNVRRYYFPGTTHGGGNGGFSATPGPLGACTLAPNPNPEDQQMAALRVALTEWVVDNREPPPSEYPTLATGTLVPANARAMGFPAIPDVPSPDGLAIPLIDYDFGDQLEYNDFSGTITRQPPTIGAIVPPLLPAVDEDGNETSGVPSVLHQAPLGTYTGWNPARRGWFAGQACGGGLTGGFIPFAKTRAERVAAGDPRPSLEERYGTQEGYVCAVTRAAEREVGRRFLLRPDADRLIAQAKEQVSAFLPATASSADAARVAAGHCT